MRATGANPRTARAQGVDTDFHIMVGIALSNALVALAGALSRKPTVSPTPPWGPHHRRRTGGGDRG